MKNEKKSLIDLIDEQILQHLLTGFCEKFNSGMKIIYFNVEGELTLIKEDALQERLWSSICSFYRKELYGNNKCNTFDIQKAEQLISSGSKEATYYYCEPLNMIDIIAPIIVQNRTIGAIITGQRIIKEDENKTIAKICEKFPEHKCKFEQLFEEEQNKEQSKIVASTEDIEKLRDELQAFAKLIGDICDKVETFEIEKHQRETFLERVAHSLSLPLESALIDTYNLKEDIDNSDDAKHLFNEIQGLVLVVKNILHGGEIQTKQSGKTDFETQCPILQLKEACEMFKAEAEDKRCDLKITLELTEKEKIPLEINDLKDINSIYKRIIAYKFRNFPESEDITIKTQNKIIHLSSVSDLVKFIYNEPQIQVFDSTNQEIKLDLSKLTAIKMNPAIIDLAYKNLIHNAIKYSYTSVNNPNHPRRFVSINCIFLKNEISVEFENYGVGITPNEIKLGKIWEPRYRGKLSQDRNRTGAGLGLAHVKWAIETIHNGKVFCESNLMEGNAYLTKFIITFNNK